MATTKRLAQGDELDTDQVNDLFIDIKAGKSPNENIYESKRKRKRISHIIPHRYQSF